MSGTEDVRVVKPPTAIVRGGWGECGAGKDIACQTSVTTPALREGGGSVKVLPERCEVVPTFRSKGDVLHTVALAALQVAPLSVETMTMNLSSACAYGLSIGLVVLYLVSARSKVRVGEASVLKSIGGVTNQYLVPVP